MRVEVVAALRDEVEQPLLVAAPDDLVDDAELHAGRRDQLGRVDPVEQRGQAFEERVDVCGVLHPRDRAEVVRHVVAQHLQRPRVPGAGHGVEDRERRLDGVEERVERLGREHLRPGSGLLAPPVGQRRRDVDGLGVHLGVGGQRLVLVA